MCGRYYVDDETAREIQKMIRNAELTVNKKRSGDVYPSQPAVVLTGRKQKMDAEEMQWGFPSYNRKGLLINARAETAAEKKTFRDSILHRRCVIPAKHFYEWDSSKNKVTFLRPDSCVLYMAGFYRSFEAADRFMIITTQANASVSEIHNRMPLILEEKELEGWIYDDGMLEHLLHKTPPLLQRYQKFEQQKLPF